MTQQTKLTVTTATAMTIEEFTALGDKDKLAVIDVLTSSKAVRAKKKLRMFKDVMSTKVDNTSDEVKQAVENAVAETQPAEKKKAVKRPVRKPKKKVQEEVQEQEQLSLEEPTAPTAPTDKEVEAGEEEYFTTLYNRVDKGEKTNLEMVESSIEEIKAYLCDNLYEGNMFIVAEEVVSGKKVVTLNQVVATNRHFGKIYCVTLEVLNNKALNKKFGGLSFELEIKNLEKDLVTFSDGEYANVTYFLHESE